MRQVGVTLRSWAQARGYDASILDGLPAEFAMPDMLVRLAAEADTVLCY